MLSRSLWHRVARRHRDVALPVAARPVPNWPMPCMVTVTVKDFATDITQSFSIMSGDTVRAVLTAYIETDGGYPRVLKVPVEIQARLS